MTAKREWPPWWDWELRFIDHAHDSMALRGFTEIEIRRMMEHATSYRRDPIEGRWKVETRYQRKQWCVIVEPIPERQVLEVITVFEDD